jgi:HEAT repeat protein
MRNLWQSFAVSACAMSAGVIGCGPAGEGPVIAGRHASDLARRLAHPVTTVRVEAASLLIAAGPAAKPLAPALRTAADDENSLVRLRAAAALARIDPEERAFAIATLLGHLRKADDKSRHISAAMALAELGPDAAPAVPLLTALLDSADWEERVWGARALGRIGEAARPSLPAIKARLADRVGQVRRNAEESIALLEQK